VTFVIKNRTSAWSRPCEELPATHAQKSSTLDRRLIGAESGSRAER
jgi:hypothetical protein